MKTYDFMSATIADAKRAILQDFDLAVRNPYRDLADAAEDICSNVLDVTGDRRDPAAALGFGLRYLCQATRDPWRAIQRGKANSTIREHIISDAVPAALDDLIQSGAVKVSPCEGGIQLELVDASLGATDFNPDAYDFGPYDYGAAVLADTRQELLSRLDTYLAQDFADQFELEQLILDDLRERSAVTNPGGLDPNVSASQCFGFGVEQFDAACYDQGADPNTELQDVERADSLIRIYLLRLSIHTVVQELEAAGKIAYPAD